MDPLPLSLSTPSSVMDLIFIDLDGRVPDLLIYPVYVIHVNEADPSEPTPEWMQHFGINPRNVCLYTQESEVLLKVVPHQACPFNNQAKLYNVFINEKLRAVIRSIHVDTFDVYLE